MGVDQIIGPIIMAASVVIPVYVVVSIEVHSFREERRFRKLESDRLAIVEAHKRAWTSAHPELAAKGVRPPPIPETTLVYLRYP